MVREQAMAPPMAIAKQLHTKFDKSVSIVEVVRWPVVEDETGGAVFNQTRHADGHQCMRVSAADGVAVAVCSTAVAFHLIDSAAGLRSGNTSSYFRIISWRKDAGKTDSLLLTFCRFS